MSQDEDSPVITKDVQYLPIPGGFKLYLNYTNIGQLVEYLKSMSIPVEGHEYFERALPYGDYERGLLMAIYGTGFELYLQEFIHEGKRVLIMVQEGSHENQQALTDLVREFAIRPTLLTSIMFYVENLLTG